jgi:hypothetical protein
MIGRRLIISFGVGLLSLAAIVNAQTTRTVGSGGNYTTLRAAFVAINSGTITGAITLQIISGTTETGSNVLNASGAGSANYTSITIYPTGSGYTISGNLASPLIDLNGADNVTIDGRVNATGTAKDLIVTNTNTGPSGLSTLPKTILLNIAPLKVPQQILQVVLSFSQQLLPATETMALLLTIVILPAMRPTDL